MSDDYNWIWPNPKSEHVSHLFETFVPTRVGVLNDAFNEFILGEKLGSGIDREVYVFLPDPDQVIKVETGNGNFQNVMELFAWSAAVENMPASRDLKNHLARVYHVSPYGCWLRMERTWPPPKNYKWPAKMPAGLTDFKRSNYGLTKRGILVCHDYGTNILMSNGISRAMRKADWWD